MSLSQRFISNFLANGYGQIVNVVVQFVAVPIYIKYWGVGVYGEWIVLSTIPTYFALAEGGFSTVAANELGVLVARGDNLGIRRILDSLFGFLLFICGVLSAILVATSMLVPWPTVLGLKETARPDAAWVILWLGFYMVASLLANIFNASYRAASAYARGMFWQTTLRLIEFIVTMILLVGGRSMVELAFAWFVTRIAGLAVMYFDVRRLAPELSLGLKDFERSEVKRLLRPSLAFMAFPIGNSLYFQGITLVVNAVLGPVAVVVFNATRTLTRVLSQAVAILKHSAWPEFSTLYGKGDLVAALKLNRAIFSMTLWISIFLGIGILIFGDYMLGLWTHKEVVVSKSMLLLYLVGVVANGLWGVASGILMGINQHEGLAVRYLLVCLVSIVVAYFACLHWGIVGAPLGMLVAELMILPYAIRQSCRVVGDTSVGLLLDSVSAKSLMNYFVKMRAKI